MIKRTDFNRLDLAKSKKSSGALALKGYLTRCGVFEYKDSSGNVTRELRHPDEVFSQDALESLENVPVVVGHPDMVNEKNWKQHAVGNVGGNAKAVKSFVSATVFVNDSQAIEAIETGNLVELSCGYSCSLEEAKGVYDGLEYDKIQRNIQYNHVGLGPEGWGRAGSAVKLYFDSQAGGYIAGMSEPEIVAAPLPDTEVVVATETVVPEAGLSTADIDAIRGQLVAAEAKIEELTLQLSAKPVEKSLDSIVAERVASRVELVRAAEKEGVELKSDSSDDACRLEILKKVSPTVAEKCDGKSSEFIQAAFTVAMSNRPNDIVRTHAAELSSATKSDSKDPMTLAYKQFNDKLFNAWRAK